MPGIKSSFGHCFYSASYLYYYYFNKECKIINYDREIIHLRASYRKHRRYNA